MSRQRKITLTYEDAYCVFGLAVLTEDRTPQEQAALSRMAELMDLVKP
jgi:hypothetical protein